MSGIHLALLGMSFGGGRAAGTYWRGLLVAGFLLVRFQRQVMALQITTSLLRLNRLVKIPAKQWKTSDTTTAGTYFSN
jgi:hypothetical protein